MQTLVFNTTTKTVKVYNGPGKGYGDTLYSLDNVPTVKAIDGYYEVRQKDGEDKQVPVLRLPIAITNQVIEQ